MASEQTWEDGSAEDIARSKSRLSPALTPEERLESVKRDLQCGKVFFYPASGFDMQPILHFHDKFSTFIYCDWAMKLEDFEDPNSNWWRERQTIQRALIFLHLNGQNVTTAQLGGIDVDMAGFLTPEEQENRRNAYNAFAIKQPWGRLLDVEINPEYRKVSTRRKVQLVYLCAEGVETYLQLFSGPHSAPEFLSINGCGFGFGMNWTDFRSYKAALGRAVINNNRSQPTLLGADQDHDWPWDIDDGHVGGMNVFRRK